MLYIIGRRSATIGHYTDTDHICYRCRAYEREVRVYREYFHLCFIPVFPMGRKQLEIRCKNCGDETRTEAIVEKYERSTKSPFWLYSGLILAACLVISWFFWNKTSQKQKIELVGNPAVGDVYTITGEKYTGTIYSFLKIARISGDSVLALHSNLEYGGFVNSLSSEDYFVKDDTVVYTKKALKQMLEKDEIFAVERNYGDGTGFNRVH